MMWPPSILRLRIHNQRRHFGLWLPLFLIWPLLLVLGVVLLPLLLVGAVIVWHKGWGKPLLFAGPALFWMLCALRGFEVDVKNRSDQVLISLQ